MIYDVFNEDLLMKCREPHSSEQHMEPALLPTIINEEEEYEVEEVWKHGKKGWGTQFLINWKGYGDEHDQWIAEIRLPHAKDAIENYQRKILSQNL